MYSVREILVEAEGDGLQCSDDQLTEEDSCYVRSCVLDSCIIDDITYADGSTTREEECHIW